MTTPQICIMIAIGAYLIFMVVIGILNSKKSKTSDDFYLGGRKLGPLVTAMSAEASDMSSWLLMGLPGVALIAGLAEASWTAIGLAVGTYLNWLIVAKRIRFYSQKLDAVTIPDFFTKRFHDRSRILTVIGALIIIIFFIPYTASGFSACGKLFSSLFGINYQTAMIVSAVVIVLYTALGGFLAASQTDLVQSVVMTVALVVILGFGISYAGGWDAVVQNAQSLQSYLNLTTTHAATSVAEAVAGTAGSADYGFLPIVSTLAWGLGYFGMPHILLRFMAIRDAHKLKTSRRIASVWVVISMGIATLIGIIGYSVVKAGKVSGLEDSERIIIEIAKTISGNGVLLALLAGLILAGILAATMSTADSQLLAAASSVSENILFEAFGIKISQKARLVIARCAVVLIAVVAVFIASDENSSVFRVVSFAWAGFGAAFGPVVLFALFWKRTNRWGALAGMISGGAMIFIWKFLVRPLGGVFDIYELLPAFLVASIAIVAVSLLTPAPEKEITDEFEEVKAMK